MNIILYTFCDRSIQQCARRKTGEGRGKGRTLYIFFRKIFAIRESKPYTPFWEKNQRGNSIWQCKNIHKLMQLALAGFSGVSDSHPIHLFIDKFYFASLSGLSCILENGRVFVDATDSASSPGRFQFLTPLARVT